MTWPVYSFHSFHLKYHHLNFSSFTDHTIKTTKFGVVLFCFTDYMEGNCGATFYMNKNNIHAVRLKASPWSSYRPDMDCLLIFETVPPERLHVVFLRLKIEFEPKCDNDFLSIYDGNSTLANGIPGLPKNICGNWKPNGAFASSGSSISVLFKSDSYQNDDGFDLVITSFHDGPCREHEFECSGKRCIDKELKCDGLDNCGDKSDECDIPTEAILGIIFGIVFVAGFAVVVVSFIRTRTETKKEKKKSLKLSFKESVTGSVNSGHMFERSDSLFPEDDWQHRHTTVSLKKSTAAENHCV
ncbi:hypothetical protein KUTeg_021552 [Tegillarca granosa]|uniref:CUB domain-containing protein n=1 Tax=Tegillarca granosa TaxID=220873 RepID=A0ABQ9E3M2_TEGGR|nr:hypothetical protein KUTeg_021552 [Tegillarca granosa]